MNGFHIPWDMIITVVCAVVGSSAFWQWLDHRSGKYGKIMELIDSLKHDISRLSEKESADTADQWRAAILRFDSELRKEEKHTQEEFIETVGLIDRYEAYCKSHADYPNTKAEVAISNIREQYKLLQRTRDYL